LWGAVAGAAYVVLLPHALQRYEEYATAISGLITVLIIMLLPGGIVDALRTVAAWAAHGVRRARRRS
jgi:ABC-type branched-subunit amino acid transport system permease subunit